MLGPAVRNSNPRICFLKVRDCATKALDVRVLAARAPIGGAPALIGSKRQRQMTPAAMDVSTPGVTRVYESSRWPMSGVIGVAIADAFDPGGFVRPSGALMCRRILAINHDVSRNGKLPIAFLGRPGAEGGLVAGNAGMQLRQGRRGWRTWLWRRGRSVNQPSQASEIERIELWF